MTVNYQIIQFLVYWVIVSAKILSCSEWSTLIWLSNSVKLVAPQMISQPHLSFCFCCCPPFPHQLTFYDLITDWNKKKTRQENRSECRSRVFMPCVWYMCVYLWIQPLCMTSPSLQPRKKTDNWFCMLVLSGSLCHSKPLTACPECHGRKPTGRQKLWETYHTGDHICLSVWVKEAFKAVKIYQYCWS